MLSSAIASKWSRESDRRAFYISIALHVVFFVVAGLSLMEAILGPPKPKPHVFTLVVGPEGGSASPGRPAAPVNGPAAPVRPLDAPRINLPDMGTVPKPKSVEEAPEEVEAPPPPLSPTTPAKPATKKTTPAPDKPVARMSEAEFRKKFGSKTSPSTKKKKTGASSAPAPARQMDVSGMTQELQRKLGMPGGTNGVNPGGGGHGTGPGGGSELDRWRTIVYLTVDNSWNKPDGANPGLSATISFLVGAGGFISNIKVLKSSGDPVFDESITLTIRRLARVEPPPGGNSLTVTGTFNMTEDWE